MKNLPLIILSLAFSLVDLKALSPEEIVADFQFQESPVPVQSKVGKISATYYTGVTAASPVYQELEGKASLSFSGSGGLIIPSQGLNYSPNSLGIFLRIWVNDLPKSTVTIAAQQGKFYVELTPIGYVSARILGVPEATTVTSAESKLKVIAGTWNDILVSFENGQAELFLNDQPAGSTGTSNALAGSQNPLSVGGVLSKAGSLEKTPDNHWRNLFTGNILRFLITRTAITPDEVQQENP